MRIFITFFAIVLIVPAFGQQFQTFKDGNSWQFWQNKMYYNAAATGFEQKKVITLNGNYLNTFSSVDEGQKNINGIISYEQPVKNSRHNFGLFANYNVSGYENNYKYFVGAASYSYGLPLGKERFLRFGVQVGIKHLSFYNFWGGTNSNIKGSAPFVNSGLFFHSKTFYGGLAVKSLYESRIKSTDLNGFTTFFKTKPYYNLTVGNTFFKDKTFSWNPNILFISDLNQSAIQVNNTIIYKKKYSLGATLIMERINTLVLNTGINIGKKLEIGASYSISSRGRILSVGQGIEVVSRIKF